VPVIGKLRRRRVVDIAGHEKPHYDDLELGGKSSRRCFVFAGCVVCAKLVEASVIVIGVGAIRLDRPGLPAGYCWVVQNKTQPRQDRP